MIIEYEDAESALEQLNKDSDDQYYWDGWSICKFKRSPAAMYDIQGSFNESLGWGFVTKYESNAEGQWNVDN